MRPSAKSLFVFGAGAVLTVAPVLWPDLSVAILYLGIGLMAAALLWWAFGLLRQYEIALRRKGTGTPKSGGRLLDMPEGRKAFVNMLVMYHGQGVADLQNGPNAGWQTERQMADWLQREGQWVGEIVGAMRGFGCSHAEIHDIGVLGPPRYLQSYASPAGPSQPFTANVARYQSFLAERLHRIKDLIKKYED